MSEKRCADETRTLSMSRRNNDRREDYLSIGRTSAHVKTFTHKESIYLLPVVMTVLPAVLFYTQYDNDSLSVTNACKTCFSSVAGHEAKSNVDTAGILDVITFARLSGR